MPTKTTRKQDAKPYQYGPATLFGGNLIHQPEFFWTIEPRDSRRTAATPNEPLHRPRSPVVRGGRHLALAGVETCTWDDVNALTTGRLTLREPEFGDGFVVPQQGDMVFCYARVHGVGTLPMWQMRVYKPQLTASSGQRAFDLKNDLELLRESEDNWLFAGRGVGSTLGLGAIPSPAKNNKGGWWGRDICQEVGRRYGIPISVVGMGPAHSGAAAPGAPWKRRWKLMKRRASPLEILRNQMIWEKRQTGIRYVMHYREGIIHITPLRRQKALRLLGATLTEAAFSSELPEEFASALTLHAVIDIIEQHRTDSRGKKQTKPVRGRVYKVSDIARKRFGYVHRIRWSPDAYTDAQLAKEAAAYLENSAKPLRRLTVTGPGIPSIRRGDAIQLALGDAQLYKQIVYVDQASHSVTPSGYTMTLTLIFDDPYIDRAKENIIFLLKSTQEEAIGDRLKNNPNAFAPNGPKSDFPAGGKDAPIFIAPPVLPGGHW